MKQPSDVTDITPGIERSEEDVCIQFPKGWNNDQAKIWLEQHNLKCCEIVPDRPFRWVAWSRPLVCSPVQAPVQDTMQCKCGWSGSRTQAHLYQGRGFASPFYLCPACSSSIEDKPTGDTPINCSCGWKGTRGMLKHTGSLTHADDWWTCPKCDKDVRTMLDEMKLPKRAGEIVCTCGWTGDRNMLTGYTKLLGHRGCPKCNSDLTLAFKALQPKN